MTFEENVQNLVLRGILNTELFFLQTACSALSRSAQDIEQQEQPIRYIQDNLKEVSEISNVVRFLCGQQETGTYDSVLDTLLNLEVADGGPWVIRLVNTIALHGKVGEDHPAMDKIKAVRSRHTPPADD